MDDHLERRVAALERAVTDGEGDAAELADAAVTADRLEDIESTLDDLEDRVAELEAATQALRGYVGNVRSVNREVEDRADLALSRVEELEGAAAGDGPASRDGDGHERDRAGEQSRADEPTRDSESAQDSEPAPGAGQGAPGGRCDRCGRPRGEQPETGGSGDPAWTEDPPGGGLAGAGPPDRHTAPPWSGDGAAEPAGDGVRAGDGPDADGPIARLRQLL